MKKGLYFMCTLTSTLIAVSSSSDARGRSSNPEHQYLREGGAEKQYGLDHKGSADDSSAYEKFFEEHGQLSRVAVIIHLKDLNIFPASYFRGHDTNENYLVVEDATNSPLVDARIFRVSTFEQIPGNTHKYKKVAMLLKSRKEKDGKEDASKMQFIRTSFLVRNMVEKIPHLGFIESSKPFSAHFSNHVYHLEQLHSARDEQLLAFSQFVNQLFESNAADKDAHFSTLKRWFASIGTNLSRLHFAKATINTNNPLQTLGITHGNCNWDNIFIQPLYDQVTLVDIIKMAESIASQQPISLDIMTFFSQMTLLKKMPSALKSELAHAFIEGYVTQAPAPIQNTLKPALIQEASRHTGNNK